MPVIDAGPDRENRRSSDIRHGGGLGCRFRFGCPVLLQCRWMKTGPNGRKSDLGPGSAKTHQPSLPQTWVGPYDAGLQQLTATGGARMRHGSQGQLGNNHMLSGKREPGETGTGLPVAQSR